MDIFYHAMNYTSKGIIDVACYGTFKRISVEGVNQLIEDLAKRNYRAPSETSGSSSRLRGSGVIELNKMSTIEAKLDALMNKVCMQEKINLFAHLVGIVEDQQKVLNDEGIAQDGPYQQKEVQFINGNRSYNFKPNTNLPTHYTALRNHENFSYGPSAHQGQRTVQNYQQQQHGQHDFQGEQQQSNQRTENQDQRRS